MKPTDPNDVKELVTLDRVLKANNFRAAVYNDDSGVNQAYGITFRGFGGEGYDDASSTPKTQTTYCVHYSYPVFPLLSEKDAFGQAFEQAAKSLVTQSGGEVSPAKRSGENGFWAAFPTDKKRMDFLKEFSRAASALNATKPEGIVKTPGGFLLGAPYGM